MIAGWTGSGLCGCYPWWSFWPSCDIGCCRCPGGQVVCLWWCVGQTHHPLESPVVECGPVAVPGSDTARRDALNCASVKVCEGFRYAFTTLSVWVDHFSLSVMCTPMNLKLSTFFTVVLSMWIGIGCSFCCFLKSTSWWEKWVLQGDSNLVQLPLLS